MADAHLSPQAAERLREELAWRSGEHRRDISLKIEIARDLPREDSGKICKRRLRDPYWQDAGRRI